MDATAGAGLLECPVCLELPLSPMLVVCENNHTVCSDCVRHLRRCADDYDEGTPCPECKAACYEWPRPNVCVNRLLDHLEPRRVATPSRRAGTDAKKEATLCEAVLETCHLAASAMACVLCMTFVAYLQRPLSPVGLAVKGSVDYLMLSTLLRQVQRLLRSTASRATRRVVHEVLCGPVPRVSFCVTMLGLCGAFGVHGLPECLVTIAVYLVVWSS